MAIQVGTVDGLINISEQPIKCFVEAIDIFSAKGVSFAKANNISFGTAFQRFVEPVYTSASSVFNVNSILRPALTGSGNEQSPARVTYCKKMGLLQIDESNEIFRLTPLGELVKDNEISVSEYAFVLLTKMGIFVNGELVDNLFCSLARYFKEHATISDEDYKSYVISQYNDDSISKTRFDIIIGALCTSGLITKVAKNVYALSSTLDSRIFEETLRFESQLKSSLLDNDPNYAEFVGSLNNGIFTILNEKNIDVYTSRFLNLKKFLKNVNETTHLIASIDDEILAKIHKELDSDSDLIPYLTAIRTKPFLLLAGISGTGKSRIVRKLAQATNDIDFEADYDGEDRWKKHNPTNFCLIQVKPNWHNSMDVVGFKSNIGGAHYEFTPFIEFIAKAWHYPDTPFFLCLDEMNLAPVEEYFAEFLSAIESRSYNKDGEYETDPIINPFDSFGPDVCGQMIAHLVDQNLDADCKLENQFRTKGLTLPKNLIVMGTVNMDETTFSFSRKVLDRAMSIEMNEVNYDAFLTGATEEDVPLLTDCNMLLVERPIYAQIVKKEIDADKIIAYLKQVNGLLDGTPFKLGYRAANEAFLYASAAKKFGSDDLGSALDKFTLMKILSRIEGDDSKLKTKTGDDLLPELLNLLTTQFGEDGKSVSVQKLTEMNDILTRDHFVSFWG